MAKERQNMLIRVNYINASQYEARLAACLESVQCPTVAVDLGLPDQGNGARFDFRRADSASAIGKVKHG